jgi:hypothetical protein
MESLKRQIQIQADLVAIMENAKGIDPVSIRVERELLLTLINISIDIDKIGE